VPPEQRRTRRWEELAPGTKRRWVGAFGGPRSLSPAERARRAERFYGAGAHLPKEHTGHLPPPQTEWSAVATTEGIAQLQGRTRRESSRLGTYAHDTRELLTGGMTDKDFARKWRRRVRTVGDAELEADPRVVRALWTVSGPPPEPFYRRRLRQAA
jgi:hypothetical protein